MLAHAHLSYETLGASNSWLGDLRCISFSPDGAKIAVGCGTTYCDAAPEKRSARILIVDVKHGRTLSALPGMRGTVYAVAFSPDGNRLVSFDLRSPWSGSRGPQIALRTWDLETQTQLATKTCPQHVTVSWSGRALPASPATVRWPSETKIFSSHGVAAVIWSPKLKEILTIPLATIGYTQVPPGGADDRILAMDADRTGDNVLVAGFVRGLMLRPALTDSIEAAHLVPGSWFDACFDPSGTAIMALHAGDVDDTKLEKNSGSSGYIPLGSVSRPKRLALFSSSGLSQVWSIEIEGNLQRVAFSSDGKYILGAHASFSHVEIKVFRRDTGAFVSAKQHSLPHREEASAQKVEYRDADILDFAVSASVAAVLTKRGIYFFDIDALVE